jgi:hypothetical protein
MKIITPGAIWKKYDVLTWNTISLTAMINMEGYRKRTKSKVKLSPQQALEAYRVVRC